MRHPLFLYVSPLSPRSSLRMFFFFFFFVLLLLLLFFFFYFDDNDASVVAMMYFIPSSSPRHTCVRMLLHVCMYVVDLLTRTLRMYVNVYTSSSPSSMVRLMHLDSYTALSVVVTVAAVDGPLSLHSAVFNSTMLALMAASVPLHTMAASCNAALLYSSVLGRGEGAQQPSSLSSSNDIIVDTTYNEESSGSAMSVVTAVAGTHGRSRSTAIYSMHCDGRIPNADAYEDVLEAAVDGCRCLIVYMADLIAEWTAQKAPSCDVIVAEG